MAYVDGPNGELFQSDLSSSTRAPSPPRCRWRSSRAPSWIDASKVDWITGSRSRGRQTRAYTNVLSSRSSASGSGAWGVVLVRGDNVPGRAGHREPDLQRGERRQPARSASRSRPCRSRRACSPSPWRPAGNFLAGLRHDGAFRTNLTVANLKDETAEVEVVFRDDAGTVLGSPARIIVEARGVKQLNAALSATPVVGDGPIGGAGWTTPTSNFSAEVKLKKGSGVYPYATVIDQGTGDSIVVTPVDPARRRRTACPAS